VSVITKLINLMLRFEYIPDAFGFSVTIPLPKDNSSKVQGVSTNYRGITVSPIISKMFELCLLNMFKKYLGSEDMQFGLKRMSALIMQYSQYVKKLITLQKMILQSHFVHWT